MKYMTTPNLPHGSVGLAAVSCTYQPFQKALRGIGIEVVAVDKEVRLEACVAGHADMLLHHLGGKAVVCSRADSKWAKKLAEFGFQVIQSNVCIQSPYPNDVALNALRVGKFLFAKPESLDETIKEYCERNGIQLVPVRQGYAKCSAAVADERSIITADEGIAVAASRVGLSVLKIRPGFISLEGCAYGFIGGTCGMIGERTIAFTGKIAMHPDGAAITSFLDRRRIQIVELTDSQLTDIGGILPLMEKKRMGAKAS